MQALRWKIYIWSMTRHIIPISGKDSLATAIVQMAMEPNLHYEFVFNQTGSELPETFPWLSKVEETLGIHIHRIGADLEGIIASYNYFLPSATARYCTRQSKIEPFEDWIGTSPAFGCIMWETISLADRQPE